MPTPRLRQIQQITAMAPPLTQKEREDVIALGNFATIILLFLHVCILMVWALYEIPRRLWRRLTTPPEPFLPGLTTKTTQRGTSTFETKPRLGRKIITGISNPWSLHPNKLERWYNENIQHGTSDFDTACREAVDKIVGYLQWVCSTNKDLFNVAEIIKGGSLGKGTMVKDLSDVDLVVFINPPDMTSLGSTDPEGYRKNLRDVLRHLKVALSGHPSVRTKKVDAYLVNFTVEVNSSAADPSRRRSLDVDLLPTARNMAGSNSLEPLFAKMLQMHYYDSGFYSASLVKFQRDFVKNQPGYVKELIRLVKYWAYTCLPKHLQKSYSLELITIYRWERAGSPSYFQKAQGLKDVLKTLTYLGKLRIYWTRYYRKALAEKSIEKRRFHNPVVLDPANPTNNVCRVYQGSGNRTDICNAARQTLRSRLLREVVIDDWWGG